MDGVGQRQLQVWSLSPHAFSGDDGDDDGHQYSNKPQTLLQPGAVPSTLCVLVFNPYTCQIEDTFTERLSNSPEALGY